MRHTFRPIVKSVDRVQSLGHITDEMIADEEMFFSCDPDFVYEYAGPITGSILFQILTTKEFRKIYPRVKDKMI